MNKIFWDLINTGTVKSFIDNVIVGTEEEEGHDKVVEEVVKRLVENDFYVEGQKSKVFRSSNRAGRDQDERKKVKEVLDWPTPKRVKDVQKFLELTNYYWQFIKNFTTISRLLHDLVKKN